MMCMYLCVNVCLEVLGLLSPWISCYALSSTLAFSLRLMPLRLAAGATRLGHALKICKHSSGEKKRKRGTGFPFNHRVTGSSLLRGNFVFLGNRVLLLSRSPKR
jgi:hypothetical protein